jgi:hypothetical protein
MTTVVGRGNVRTSMESQLVLRPVPTKSSSNPAHHPFLAALQVLRRAGLGGPVLALLFAMNVSAPAELIYDNSTNYRAYYVSLQEEFGDEIDFTGTARVITSMAFSVLGETNLPPNVSARFRIYRNNGPILPFETVDIATPGELLYESADIPILPGPQTIRIADVAVPVPNYVTWTILIRGAGTEPGTRAGLEVYHPPTVGSSFRDYWVRAADGFQLQLLEAGVSASFAARFEAIPDPPVVMSVTNTPSGSLVTITGPVGTEHVLESSTDGQHWRTVGTIRLLTTAEGSLLDTATSDGTPRLYRTRLSPYPGSSVVLREIQSSTNGTSTLYFAGPRNSAHILEASEDRVHWKPIDVIYLLFGVATYEDKIPSGVNRFYRTRHPTGRGPVYLIRGIRREPNGSVVVAASGLPDLKPAIVEATTDFRTWTEVGTVQFITPQAEFRDTDAANHPARLYRIRR